MLREIRLQALSIRTSESKWTGLKSLGRSYLVGAIGEFHEGHQEDVHGEQGGRYQRDGQGTYCRDGGDDLALPAALILADVDPAESQDDLRKGDTKILAR